MTEAADGKRNLRVGKATTREEKEAVYRLRYSISVEEMKKRPDYADHVAKMLTDPLDQIATVLYLAEGNEIVAAVRNIWAPAAPEARQVQFYELDKIPEVPREAMSFTSRLIIAPRYRSTMALGVLLAAIYQEARSKGIWLDFINCAPPLVSLYEVLGYRRFMANVLDTDVGLSVPMALVADDVEYLTRVHSPFARMAPAFANDPAHGAWFAKRFAEYAQPSCARVMGTDEFLRYLTERVHVDDYPLLRGLAEGEVKEVLHSGTIVRAQKGNLVIRAGDPGHDMYMVMSGVLEVRARSKTGSHVIETLGKGQVFGEMSFLNGRPRTADVAAVTDAEVLLITRDFLERLTRGAPAVAARLLMNLSIYLADRLQNTTRSLVDAMARGESPTVVP
jgi:hypothetical protein